MSIIDKLLETDVKKFELEAKKYEIKRLSDILEEPFFVTIMPLTMEQIRHIGEITKDGNERELAIVEACRINGEKITNKDLMKKFGCVDGCETVGKLLQPGEIQSIYSIINDISGYKQGVVEEVKN